MKNISEMDNEEKYTEVIALLKRSVPDPSVLKNIDNEVLEAMVSSKKKESGTIFILDSLFGWVNIGWARRSFITIAIFFAGLFIYQQFLILDRITILERHSFSGAVQLNERAALTGTNKFLIEKVSGRYSRAGSLNIRSSDLNRLISSYAELETRYKELMQLVEDDPQLMDLLRKKLEEKNIKKLKL